MYVFEGEEFSNLSEKSAASLKRRKKISEEGGITKTVTEKAREKR